MALFALSGALIGAIFLVYRTISALVNARLSLFHPSMVMLVGGT